MAVHMSYDVKFTCSVWRGLRQLVLIATCPIGALPCGLATSATTTIAYQIRFDSSRGAGTRLTFMTEGILLRRLAGDPQLRDFDCVVLDEVHHR
eukprot:scaffold170251_cov29-Prasinocladus_malaysianus.AAC.1